MRGRDSADKFFTNPEEADARLGPPDPATGTTSAFAVRRLTPPDTPRPFGLHARPEQVAGSSRYVVDVLSPDGCAVDTLYIRGAGSPESAIDMTVEALSRRGWGVPD